MQRNYPAKLQGNIVTDMRIDISKPEPRQISSIFRAVVRHVVSRFSEDVAGYSGKNTTAARNTLGM